MGTVDSGFAREENGEIGVNRVRARGPQQSD
jgi:hypothetical protein